MRTEDKDPVTDVGVIIGRFQVDELHEGHIQLIQSVFDKHHKVIIFLGLSPIKCTYNNPLDFEARKQMLSEAFPQAHNILYIKDMSSNFEWSKKLDEMIKDVIGPRQTVSLYGSRDSFIKHYEGKHKCVELEQTIFVSGNEIRQRLSNKVKNSKGFRAGIIYATRNQYINATPCIDLAIFNKDRTKLLLGRKKYETHFRFVGGHVDPDESFEDAAMREGEEETGLKILDVKYVGSRAVDDWRHKFEKSAITTVMYETCNTEGKPEPQDDIEELKWFDVGTLEDVKVGLTFVPEHLHLYEMLFKNKS